MDMFKVLDKVLIIMPSVHDEIVLEINLYANPNNVPVIYESIISSTETLIGFYNVQIFFQGNPVFVKPIHKHDMTLASLASAQPTICQQSSPTQKYPIGTYFWSPFNNYTYIISNYFQNLYEIEDCYRSKCLTRFAEKDIAQMYIIDWQNLPIGTKIRTKNNFYSIIDGEYNISSTLYGAYLLDQTGQGIFSNKLPSPDCEILEIPKSAIDVQHLLNTLPQPPNGTSNIGTPAPSLQYYANCTSMHPQESVELNHKEELRQKCMHPKKYLNIISPSLKFWSCPDCKGEVE